MSTIYDRAVRALQDVHRETGADGYPLAYCCAPGCLHRSCAAVRALDEADMLHYPDAALAATADLDHLRALATELTDALIEREVPFEPRIWNAYWAVRGALGDPAGTP